MKMGELQKRIKENCKCSETIYPVDMIKVLQAVEEMRKEWIKIEEDWKEKYKNGGDYHGDEAHINKDEWFKRWLSNRK